MTKNDTASDVKSVPYAAERARRWRLILGADSQDADGEAQAGAPQNGQAAPGAGAPGEGDGGVLNEDDKRLDETLNALYGEGDAGGEGDSSPDIARLLGDVRRYFPSEVAQIMQRDALKTFKLKQLLKDPESLAALEPDLALASQLVALAKFMPAETKETARSLVQQVVDEIKTKLEYPLEQAVKGALQRALKTRRPRRVSEIDWLSTVYRNLKHYQPDLKTVIPETLRGYGRSRASLRDVILCIDQSGSMAKSVVYASVFGSVLASLPALNTRLVLFDTNVADLSEHLSDPVDLLFGLQLKGGTNIERALRYCGQLVTRPRDTVLVLISDLFEGAGQKGALQRRAAELMKSGVRVVVLLALNDEGTPRYHAATAQDLADLDIPTFACTPQRFPDIMGAVLEGKELGGRVK